jgi:hypothetical protein
MRLLGAVSQNAVIFILIHQIFLCSLQIFTDQEVDSLKIYILQSFGLEVIDHLRHNIQFALHEIFVPNQRSLLQ